MARVLVVDDEPDLRFLLRRFLERAGHEVTDAANGALALELVHGERPDLIITDIGMPVMGGVEFIRRLREDPALAQIPIAAISANPPAAVGADVVRRKPCDWNDLVAVAEVLLKEGRGPQ